MATDLSTLNQQQRNAVLQSINQNVVLLAGAGSGKTTTLVKRTQYLMQDLQVPPESIMLVTFTNKAAAEIRERVSSVVPAAYRMWIGTFHSICVKLLRMHGNKIGLGRFNIMDGNDSKAVVREIMKNRGHEYNQYLVNHVRTKISEYKNNMRRPAEVLADQSEERICAAVYQDYQNMCWNRHMVDFDDLIIYTILLLSQCQDVSNWVRQAIRYTMVDEAQDMNSAQFVLTNLICGSNNVLLCGDVNQSIYAFRNAKPQYLQDFIRTHPNTIQLKIEQNYRSTKTVISAANRVVCNNSFGTKLEMFCDNEQGMPIQLKTCGDSYDEARWVAAEICSEKSKGRKYGDCAVIYRTNSQSHFFEEVFASCGIPYTIFGSQSFYSRKEVRDLLAYLKVYTNPDDFDSFKRVLGTYKGIGDAAVNSIITFAKATNLNAKTVLPEYIKSLAGKKPMMANRLKMLHKVLSAKHSKCSNVISDVLWYTEYKKDLMAVQTDETIEKAEIIDEFASMLKEMEKNADAGSMEEIIDQIALLSYAKGADKANMDCVKMMTAHSSKGLEFTTVFLVGMEEGIFPHANSINTQKPEDIEEERRLFYVAMTRAKKELYITNARTRRGGDYSGSVAARPSRFISEIPGELTEEAF